MSGQPRCSLSLRVGSGSCCPAVLHGHLQRPRRCPHLCSSACNPRNQPFPLLSLARSAVVQNLRLHAWEEGGDLYIDMGGSSPPTAASVLLFMPGVATAPLGPTGVATRRPKTSRPVSDASTTAPGLPSLFIATLWGVAC
eukprot:jgi/Botrbrau1/12827/Bobra.20_1s0017.1